MTEELGYKQLMTDEKGRVRFFNKKKNVQITIQETYGRGRAKGKYEVLYFDLNKGIGGKSLGNSDTMQMALRRARIGRYYG